MKRQNFDNNALDRELDVALSRLAAAEPRAGLEDRILANLRIEQQRAAEPSRWRWPILAALAATIALTAFVAWRSRKPVQNLAAQHPQVKTQTDAHNRSPLAGDGQHVSTRIHELSGRRPKSRAFSHPATVAGHSPKLDQFPSPQPLSEQETILAHYITNYPEHAALIAQARTDELRRDSAEETGEPVPGGDDNSLQRNK
jgi:hypothetical protein